MERSLPINNTVLAQADFLTGGYARVGGITTIGLTLDVFFNNTRVAWTLVTGVSVVDGSVTAGYVYFHEIETGFYSVRLRPNAIGYWRVILNYTAGSQRFILDLDVGLPEEATPGLVTSFI